MVGRRGKRIRGLVIRILGFLRRQMCGNDGLGRGRENCIVGDGRGGGGCVPVCAGVEKEELYCGNLRGVLCMHNTIIAYQNDIQKLYKSLEDTIAYKTPIVWLYLVVSRHG